MKRSLGALDIVLGCFAAALLLALGWARFWVVPTFAGMFRDFGDGPLPAVTRLALGNGYYGVAALVVLASAGAGLLWRRTAALAAAVVVGGLAVALVFWGMYAPIFELAGAIRAD